MADLIRQAGTHTTFETGAVVKVCADEMGQLRCEVGGSAALSESDVGREGFASAASGGDAIPLEPPGLSQALPEGTTTSEGAAGHGRGRGRQVGKVTTRAEAPAPARATRGNAARRGSTPAQASASQSTMDRLEAFMARADQSFAEFGNRLGRLEAERSEPPRGALGGSHITTAADLAKRPGAQGLGNVTKSSSPAALPQQLPWGGLGGPPPARPSASSISGASPGGPVIPSSSRDQAPTGERAFDQAMQAAMQAFGSRAETPAPAEPRVRDGGGRRKEDINLEAAIQEGGPNAQMALQLATLEALERIGNRQSRSSSEPTLEEMLYGFGPSDSDGNDPVGKIAGSRGAAGLLQLARAIEADPTKWSAYCDRQAAAGCGALTSGLPWSMSLYGERCVKFNNVQPKERGEDYLRFWEMFAALHALHSAGQHELLGAKLRQFLKSIEQAAQARGSWRLAWLMTGLPDPLPQGTPGTGLLHPAELAAAAGYVREMDTLEGIARKHIPKGGGAPKGEKKDDP